MSSWSDPSSMFVELCKDKSLNPFYDQETHLVTELCSYLQALVNFRHWGSSSNDIISPLFIDVFNAYHGLPAESDLKKYFSLPETFILSKEKNHQGEKKCQEYRETLRSLKMQSLLGSLFEMYASRKDNDVEEKETTKHEPEENCCETEKKQPSEEEKTPSEFYYKNSEDLKDEWREETEAIKLPLNVTQNLEL